MLGQTPRNPFPTVDIIIEMPGGGIVLVRRKNPPHGWALPGGFVDYGESCESAAVREAREETSLEVELLGQLGTWSDPSRDPRHHTVTTVFVGRPLAGQVLRAGSDAAAAMVFAMHDLPRQELCFDHARIIDAYFASEPRLPLRA